MTRSNGKMTLTFSKDKYKELLSKYQPKLIETETENEQTLELIEGLMYLESRSPEQEAIYDLLIVLVEKFEREFYQSDTPNRPASMLLFLMEQQDVTPRDLVSIFGSEKLVEDIIDGKVDIDKTFAQQLSKLFNVDASLFC
jgi:HTH-type transcriptional regulator / antitoxin HigA